MSGIEIVVGAAAAGAVLGLGGAGAACEFFLRKEKNKWSLENRPCNHPFECDFFEALGMIQDFAYTTKDIEKHARQATRWWHPDKNGGVDNGFRDFERIVTAMKSARHRKLYIQAVKSERAIMQECNEEMRWRPFNVRFLRDVETKMRTMPTTGAGGTETGSDAGAERAEEIELCHVFLDGSASMACKSSSKSPSSLSTSMLNLALSNQASTSTEESMTTNVAKGKGVFSNLYPRFLMTPTSIHLVGSNEGPQRSRRFVNHQDVLDGREQELLGSWSTDSDGTYLWHYIYEQTKDFKDCKHDIIIITDGIDNRSPERFAGLHGFNELMARLAGGKIRISLYLIGNSLSSSDGSSYHDLCLATGGVFHHDAKAEPDASAAQAFLVPLLLPEGERDRVATRQRMTYEHMLQNGEAQRFAWYLPLADLESSGASAGQGRLPFKPNPRHSGSNRPLPQLVASARVELIGLQSSRDLNGKRGTCGQWLADRGRWEVKLDEDGETKALLPNNLQVLACSGPSSSQHVYSEL